MTKTFANTFKRKRAYTKRLKYKTITCPQCLHGGFSAHFCGCSKRQRELEEALEK